MPTYTDSVFIDGSQDDPQLRVQGHTTQTDPLQTWENSTGVKLAQVDSNGQVFIDGSQDVTLLRVQAHSAQNQALQAWENSAGTALAQITNDGRLEVGNNAVGGVPAALIEASQGNILAGSQVKQGIQSNGVISGAISEPLVWSVHELAFGGSGGVGSNHTGLRSKITQNNTGSSPNAIMRAGEFKVENNQTLNKAVAIRAEIANASGGSIAEAVALEVVMPSVGTIGTLYGLNIPDLTVGTNRYAIKTGLGKVEFGDSVRITGSTPTGSSAMNINASVSNADGVTVSPQVSSNVGRNLMTMAGIFVPTDEIQQSDGGVYGIVFNPVIGGTNSNNIYFYAALYGGVRTSSDYSGDIQYGVGAYINNPLVGNGSTQIANNYGLYIVNQAAGTNNWAIRTEGGRVQFGDSVDIPSSNYFYLGDPNTDGTWRIGRDGANLVFQRRVAGSYATKSTITG